MWNKVLASTLALGVIILIFFDETIGAYFIGAAVGVLFYRKIEQQ